MYEQACHARNLAVTDTCLTILDASAASCSSSGWEGSPPHGDHLDIVLGGDSLNGIASIDSPHKGVLRLNSYDV